MQTILDIATFDNHSFQGKLTVPNGNDLIEKLVIYVNGSGANTYDNKRPGFNYFDLFAEQFSANGTAFFSYNTRGCKLGDKPPMYVDIDMDEYQTYLPLNSVEDVLQMIKTIKKIDRLHNCNVYLLGWSEGSVIAPLVAEKYPDFVDCLLLAGYVNQNMKDVLVWQNDGSPSMVWYKNHFQTDTNGRIDKKTYEADPDHVISSVLSHAKFEEFDRNHDGFISKEDMKIINEEAHGYTLQDLIAKIESRDDEWLRKNYGGGLIPLTSAWFLQHFSLRSNSEVLPNLNLPIFIFHGTLDLNVDVNEVYKIRDRFKELGKNNLKINVFEHHDHDLNFGDYITKKELSEGIKAIFECVANNVI